MPKTATASPEAASPRAQPVGRPALWSDYVQTGLRTDSAFDVQDPADTCDVWTNSAGGSVVAYASSTTTPSLNISTYQCTTPQPVYCLER